METLDKTIQNQRCTIFHSDGLEFLNIHSLGSGNWSIRITNKSSLVRFLLFAIYPQLLDLVNLIWRPHICWFRPSLERYHDLTVTTGTTGTTETTGVTVVLSALYDHQPWPAATLPGLASCFVSRLTKLTVTDRKSPLKIFCPHGTMGLMDFLLI